MRSLRARLLVGTIAGMSGLLTLSSTMAYALIRHSLVRSFDATSFTLARTVARLVEQNGDRTQLEYDDVMPDFERKHRPDYFQIWHKNGATVTRSPSLGQKDLDPLVGTMDKPTFRPVTLPNGQPGPSP